MTAYDTALAKTVGAGPRIDVVFASMRVALFAADVHLLKTKIDEASKYAHAFERVFVPCLCLSFVVVVARSSLYLGGAFTGRATD